MINYIRVDRTGTATNSDVPTAKLYRDVNKNNVVDGSDVQLDQTQYFQGTTTQNAYFQALNYYPSTSENLIIVYDVAADANTSNTAGASMPAGYITGGSGTIVTFAGITTGNQPLPVELTSFTASYEKNFVMLKWTTATEVNNYGFDIERAFVETQHAESLRWKKIGFVQGYGNSNSPKEYSFEDKNPQVGKLQYRLKQIDFDGTYEYSNTVEVNFDAPVNFILEQNYPNPFNPETVISYTIGTSQLSAFSNVSLKIFDVLGREVATLVNEFQQAGEYNSQFSIRNYQLSSGVYFYTLQVGNYFQSKKMLLLK
ncbi:MAG: T9SS type A sorting domain-containing protein [Bacteroidota bacterium]